MMRSRLLHDRGSGEYTIGRHNSSHQHVLHPPGALILWFGFSPWNERFIQRKLQIKDKVPPQDKAVGFGRQHLMPVEELEATRLRYAAFSDDLRERIEYRRIFSAWPYPGQALERARPNSVS